MSRFSTGFFYGWQKAEHPIHIAGEYEIKTPGFEIRKE